MIPASVSAIECQLASRDAVAAVHRRDGPSGIEQFTDLVRQIGASVRFHDKWQRVTSRPPAQELIVSISGGEEHFDMGVAQRQLLGQFFAAHEGHDDISHDQ